MLDRSKVRRVLIYRLGSLGDTVVALPCYHLIARRFPNAERRLLTNFPINGKAPAAAAVLGESGLIHGYMRYTVGTRNLAELLRLALEIRRFDPDVVVYLLDPRPVMNVWRDRIFFLLCGVRRIVGLPSRDQLDYRFDAATQLYESEARRLARAIAVIGDAHVDDLSNWSLHLQSDELDVADRLLSPFASMPIIVCAPGCKMQANDWEQHNWRALLGRLYRRYPSHALVMSGAKEDAEVCDFAALDWGAA